MKRVDQKYIKANLIRCDIRAQLNNFLAAPYNRTWLYAAPMEFYVRKGVHGIRGDVVSTFDLATINIADRKQRGQGLFTILVEEVERLRMNVYIENILEPRLLKFFKKRGYIKVANNSMFRKTT